MKTLFTCSIDDGHPSDLKMAELLVKNELEGTFFIPIKNREGIAVMSCSQIRDIAQIFEVGSHTYDHRFLNTASIGQAHFQVKEGKKILENMLGKRLAGFCYPGGKYRQEHVNLVRAAGFEYARTTTNLCFDVGNDRFAMPTTCQFYPHRRSVYLRNFISAGDWRRRQAGLRTALRQINWLDRIYMLFDFACARGAVFHLWAHSNDIDRFALWRELDLFLEYVTSKIGPKERVNNGQLASLFFKESSIVYPN
jgi:peptidoglycan/xylan/chitin deacetylase (PgdA/CDA1 family)